MCSGFLVTAKGFLDPPEKSGTVQGRYGEQLRLARRHPRGAFSFARVHFAFHFRRTTPPIARWNGPLGRPTLPDSHRETSERPNLLRPLQAGPYVENQMAFRTMREPITRRLGSTGPTPETPPAPPVPPNESPLEYMLRIMRDRKEDDERRDAMAKAALPYMHARLSNVDGQISDNEGGTITFTWQPAQK